MPPALPQSPGLGPLQPASPGSSTTCPPAHPGPACGSSHPARKINALRVGQPRGVPSPRSPACPCANWVSALRRAWPRSPSTPAHGGGPGSRGTGPYAGPAHLCGGQASLGPVGLRGAGLRPGGQHSSFPLRPASAPHTGHGAKRPEPGACCVPTRYQAAPALAGVRGAVTSLEPLDCLGPVL